MNGGVSVESGGTPASPPPQPSLDDLPKASGRATAAFVLGVLGLLGTICLITFPAAIPAWILGHMERRDIRNGQAPVIGYGMATAGWILGIIGSVLFALILFIFMAFLTLGLLGALGTMGSMGGFSGMD